MKDTYKWGDDSFGDDDKFSSCEISKAKELACMYILGEKLTQYHLVNIQHNNI
jgi:hypothetical protein